MKQICIGQQARPRIWAKHGTKSRAPRDRRYEWAYIFGVGCPPRRATAGNTNRPYRNPAPIVPTVSMSKARSRNKFLASQLVSATKRQP